MERKIYLVTTNPGKIKEIRKYLEPEGVDVRILEGNFVEIQSRSLEEVLNYGLYRFEKDHDVDQPFIKDDSGLFVEALSGFPGVYSSYVQETLGNDGILSLMEGVENRNATFKTVIGLRIPERGTSLFRGVCSGTISEEKRGKGGFGYDPIFIPDGKNETFAEMSISDKNRISHRTRAIQGLMDYLKNKPDLL